MGSMHLEKLKPGKTNHIAIKNCTLIYTDSIIIRLSRMRTDTYGYKVTNSQSSFDISRNSTAPSSNMICSNKVFSYESRKKFHNTSKRFDLTECFLEKLSKRLIIPKVLEIKLDTNLHEEIK